MAGNQGQVIEYDSQGDEQEDPGVITTKLLSSEMIMSPTDYEFYLLDEKVGSDVFKASVIMTAYPGQGSAMLAMPILASPYEFYSFFRLGQEQKAFNLGTDQVLLDNIFNNNKELVSEDPNALAAGKIYINYEQKRLEFPAAGTSLKKFWANTVHRFNVVHSEFTMDNPERVFQFRAVWVNDSVIRKRHLFIEKKSMNAGLPEYLKLSSLDYRKINDAEIRQAHQLALFLRQGYIRGIAPLLKKLQFDAEVKSVFHHLNTYAESNDAGVREYSRRVEALLIHGYLMVCYRQQSKFEKFQDYCANNIHEDFVHKWFMLQRPWLESKVKPVMDDLLNFIMNEEFTLGQWGSRRSVPVKTESGVVDKPVPHGFWRIYLLLKAHQPGGNLLKLAHEVSLQAHKRSKLKQSTRTMLFKGAKRIRSGETVDDYQDTITAIKNTHESLGPIGPSVLKYNAI